MMESEMVNMEDERNQQQSEYADTEATLTENSENLAQLKQEIAAAQENYLRIAADFENYKKRQNREMEDFRKYASEKIFRELLPVVDNLERALQAAEQPQAQLAQIVTGVKMVAEQLKVALENQGVKGFSSTGQAFDPSIHEAVSEKLVQDMPSGTVVEEFQKGYLLHSRVLRPAMVIVAKNEG